MSKKIIMLVAAVSLLTYGGTAFANSAGLDVSFFTRQEVHLAKLQNRIERRVEDIKEKMEKKRDSLEAKFETKTEKFEAKHLRNATSTPFILDVGHRGHAVLRGIVSGNASSTLSVKSWGGTWNVLVASTTALHPKGEVITDIKVGDYIGVIGTVVLDMTLTIAAKNITDRTR